MSKMLRLELVGLVLLASTQILTEHRDPREARGQYGYQRHRYQEFLERKTREVRVNEGRLRGIVVKPVSSYNLQEVDVFLGIPYAEAPVGDLRFAPSRRPLPWRDVRNAVEFAPVCPQVLPNLRDEVKPGRYEYLERHLTYLKNQSEDCLYLNIYAPHQPGEQVTAKYPVMVFIHGESFDWNSGNPYDGTILASYGNVVFVTINFRLGILGFLRPGTKDGTISNFGLLDQTSALFWLQQNIGAFGGDPKRVTVIGHGTGAIFANLLLISPPAVRRGLIRRAILMSGSALSFDAIGKGPLQITTQVAMALNCPTEPEDDLVSCLRAQSVDALLKVKVDKPRYIPAYSPLTKDSAIPENPLVFMQDNQIFGRYDLMYGVTESEKFHILSPVALLHGMLDAQRDEVLRDYAKATHGLEPGLVLSKVLEHYGDFSSGYTNEYARKNRDLVLEALSDSGTVAPLAMTANLHSKANPQSYMYVFSHPKAMQDYSGQQQLRTIHGEELPYILGMPLDEGKYDLRGRYNMGEKLFSEAMMSWWCNFAYSGNPNVGEVKPSFRAGGPKEWRRYEIDWPEYNSQNQTYLNLTIPPRKGSHYREDEMYFWNEYLPIVLKYPNKDIPVSNRPKGPRPEILNIADGIARHVNSTPNTNSIFGIGQVPKPSPGMTDANERPPFPFFFPTSSSAGPETTTQEPAILKNSSVISMVIGFGIVFLLINITTFLYLYHKRHSLKTKEKTLKRRLSQKDDCSKRPRMDGCENNYGELGYKSDSKPDINDVIKNDKAYDNNSNFGRRSKLSRQNSGSTIDTHIKVKEWIQQEIVHRCSPRFLRKTRETLQREHQEKQTKQQQEERKRLEREKEMMAKTEPIYDESPTITVRPGKKSKLPKISVGIDATPATRTESILNQVPIELAKSEKSYESYEFPSGEPIGELPAVAPQVVVIEHHHSRSDPLPMEYVMKNVKPNFSSPRICESDSGSASSLYAKINPKMKSRLPRPDAIATNESAIVDELRIPDDKIIPAEDIYGRTGTKLTTFAAVDVNVTCREPTVEKECISPEEALRTIKRRNYPKVLPDIEKRRSLPAPNSLFMPKSCSSSLKDYKSVQQQNPCYGYPPVPPPRMFGTSKSLDFVEENESQCEKEPITTNLHVGPLLKKQEPTSKNNSDPSIIDSVEASMSVIAQPTCGSVDTIFTNPKCPVHGTPNTFSPSSQSTESNIDGIGKTFDTGLGNPNWYRPPNIEYGRISPGILSASSEPRIVITPREAVTQAQIGGSNPNWDIKTMTTEPKIVITPKVVDPMIQIARNANQTLSELKLNCTGDSYVEGLSKIPNTSLNHETISKILTGPNYNTPFKSSLDSIGGSADQPFAFAGAKQLTESRETERKEPRIIITPRDTKNSGAALISHQKQPKIIIKPTSTLQRTRDQRNIPKVSAIPSPEKQNLQNIEKDRNIDQPKTVQDKPPLREKPKVSRIPSFSRKIDNQAPSAEKSSSPAHVEKTEIVQRVDAVVMNKIINSPPIAENRTCIPMLLKKENDKMSSTDSSNSNGNSNTGTIKRKPNVKK